MLGTAGYYTYRLGGVEARYESALLAERVGQLTDAVGQLEQGRARLESELAAANQRASDWQARYERDVPTTDLKPLFDTVRAKLDAGVESARLAFVLGAIENQRACDETPSSKRFLVQTPLSTGVGASVGFANNAITVTGEGRSAIDAEGNPEARFDPAEPVTIRFALLGGRTAEIAGVLPLHRSIVEGGYEYRFSIVPGDAGFALITGDRCGFP